MDVYIGCAGWNLRKEFAEEFSPQGTHLARYAGRFNAVEINSSFYRPHRTATYARWAACTPSNFRFAVKLPKQITHVCRLAGVNPPLEQFLGEIAGLGEKLGTILVQLPPSLAFDATVAAEFFAALRARTLAPVVCEPRHPSWFDPPAETLMVERRIARVAADPSVVPTAAVCGGWPGTCYFRWHGSPRTYYSSYDDSALAELASRLLTAAENGRDAWCIFDNTALGAATQNALSLQRMVPARRESRP